MIVTCHACQRPNRLKAADLSREARCGQCKTPLTPLDRPLDADVELFDEVARDSPLPVLVDFWAEWCGPCRAAAPEVKRLAGEMAGRVVVLKVDTESHPDLATRYRVSSIPNFVVLKAGRVVFQKAGAAPAAQMAQWVV